MLHVMLEFGVLALLACLNGFFSMAELALLTARKGVLMRLAGKGDRRAAQALRLARNPDKFLSAIQLGITTLGILAGAFGGASVAGSLGAALAGPYLSEQWAHWIAMVVATAAATSLTIIIGELAPKRLAINHAERLALVAAPPVALFMRLAAPAVAALSAASRFVLLLLGQGEPVDSLSEDDVRAMVAEAMSLGVLEKSEMEMIERVIRFGNRRISSLMTYRSDMVWLDVEASDEENIARISRGNHSHYPVSRRVPAGVFGVAAVKDLFNDYFQTRRLDIAKAAKEPLFAPETMRCLDLLDAFKKKGTSLAVVVDEYGDIQGVVAQKSVLRAIVGEIREEGHSFSPTAQLREDGALSLAGTTPMDEVLELLDADMSSLSEAPDAPEGTDGPEGADAPLQGFSTLAGFVMARLGRIPEVGEGFTAHGRRIEVAEKSGNRITRVVIAKNGEAGDAVDAEESGG